MKKIIATVLAVVLTLSICAVSATADETTAKKISMIPANVSAITVAGDAEVTVIQPGDILAFVKKTKKFTVTYYPDAAVLTGKDVKNTWWSGTYIPSLGEISTYAKSEDSYKYFKWTTSFSSSLYEYTVAGIGDEATLFDAYDSTNYCWGQFPIDYQLEGVEFKGWVVKAYANGSSSTSVDLYALWDRSTSTISTTNPDVSETETEPESTTDPSQQPGIIGKMEAFFNIFRTGKSPYTSDDWQSYLTFVPNLAGVLFGALAGFIANGDFERLLFEWLGIEA